MVIQKSLIDYDGDMKSGPINQSRMIEIESHTALNEL